MIGYAQTVSITSTGTAFTQNFDGIGSTATATLPAGFRVSNGIDWAAGTSATTVAAGSTGTGAITGTSGGGTYNFANGITASSTDRALGFLSSGSFASPRSIILKLTNNTGTTITDLTISFDYEKYRSGTRAFDWTFFHGSTTSPATAEVTGNQSYASDANNTTIPNPPTSISKSVTLTGLNISNGSDYYLRWTYTGNGGSTNAQALGLDNFSITATGGGADVTPPTVTTLTPLDNATEISVNTNLQITFNEPVLKGTGNIVIKKSSDNSVVQTIDVTTANVSVSTTTATITINPLVLNTSYYVEVDNGAFTDAAANAFTGITGATTWNFTTTSIPAAGVLAQNYSFTDCATFLPDGWRTFNVVGAQVWTCATGGRTADNAMFMNGFSGTAQTNEDWLISPPYDLTGVTAPTLKFYSKSQFAGNTLELRVSTNYIPGTNPNTATWTTITGNFPAVNSNVFTLSDNIDLSAFNTSNVKIAWVYISNTTTGASRWTIDDVSVYSTVVLPPCVEPADQPTNVTLSATPTSISGSFTLPATAADAYLVVRSTSSTLSSLPVDGTNYNVGQTVGGGTVILNGTLTSFTDNGLTPSTQYYYFVFSYNNENCSAGPNYLLTLNPAPTGNTNTATTLALAPCVEPTAAPTALVLNATNATITGSFTAAAGANRYLVIYSTANTPVPTPVDGTTYTVGAAIGNGFVGAYTTNTNFTITGLTAATQYYIFVYSANAECTGEPDYFTGANLGGTVTTTNGTGVPAGYYDAATALNCQPLKTAVKNIITNGANTLTYTPGLWNLYQYSDLHRNDANTADIIWDMYSDNPTGPEPYTYTYNTNQCGTYTGEGGCYNREHSTPQSWFNQVSPMVSDAHHIFPTDGKVNATRSNFPYGEVTTPTSTSLNGSKLGSGNNFGYTSTVFEPINAYKGDFARAGLYMAVRYEDEIISQNWSQFGNANQVFLSAADEPDAAKRRLQIYDAWYLQTLIKWHTNDPVSQKEIDRNNAIYYQPVISSGSTPIAQANRNPFVDHPEYAALMFQCTGLLPVTLIDFTAQKNNNGILLKWYATFETSFKQYDVERSIDGNVFNKIGQVQGNNLTNYSFNDDKLPATSVVYYRLKMIDLDGKFKYSKIVSVKLNNNLSNAIVYPNPTMGALNVRLVETLQQNSQLQIIDVAGRIVKQQSVNANQININLDVQNLAAGRYFIKIKNNTQVIQQSFVVIK